MIPKLIMQTWKTDIIPKHWEPSQISIKNYMSDWKYVLLTDNDNLQFVKNYFPNLLSWFQLLHYPIQRADVIRYMWLYVNGGLYLDLDIELNVSLEELFTGNMETWLLKAPRNFAGHYTNFLMASTPKNTFWLSVIEECTKPLEPWVILPHHIISHQTGLGALTRAVKNWKKPIALLPQDSLVPCDYCNPSACTKPFSYTRFLKGQSWNGIDTHALNFLSCNPEIFLFLFLCLFTLQLFRSK